MSLLLWLLLGLIAGLAAIWIAGSLAIGCLFGTGCFTLIIVAAVCAVVSSVLFNVIGFPLWLPVQPFTSVIIGVLIVMLVCRIFKHRR